MWAKHHKISWQRPLLTKRPQKEVLVTYFSESGPADSRFNLLIFIFFFVFSRALSLCPVVHSEPWTTDQSSERGCPDRQRTAGISLIHKTFTQAGGQCMVCKCWGGRRVDKPNVRAHKVHKALGWGSPPQSRVSVSWFCTCSSDLGGGGGWQGLCPPGERNTFFIIVIKAAICPVTQGPQPRRR